MMHISEQGMLFPIQMQRQSRKQISWCLTPARAWRQASHVEIPTGRWCGLLPIVPTMSCSRDERHLTPLPRSCVGKAKSCFPQSHISCRGLPPTSATSCAVQLLTASLLRSLLPNKIRKQKSDEKFHVKTLILKLQCCRANTASYILWSHCLKLQSKCMN